MRYAVLEQLKPLIVYPGAKPNHLLLGIDLSEVNHAVQVLTGLMEQGYQPQLRYLQLAIGLHIFAILKDEAYVSEKQFELLQDEWEKLCDQLSPYDPNKVVRLWLGLPAIAA